MREQEVLVRFRSSDREAYVLPGTKVVEAAAEAGIVLSVPCGGEGLCGKCRVKISDSASQPTAAEQRHFTSQELEAGWRLACQATILESTEIEVPRESESGASHKILTRSAQAANGTVGDAPPVRKKYVELPPPARGDDAADAIRLERALGAEPLRIERSLLQRLPALLRATEFRGTAVLAGDRLLDFESDNTETDAFAVALDIGTTTLVGSLLDLSTGSEWAVDARLNPQTRFGDDVLSRILYASNHAHGLRELQESIITAVNETITTLCRQAGVPPQRIYEVTIAGNTTMQQLLAGIDTRSLGEVPFVATSGRGIDCSAAEMGIAVHPRANVYCLPNIGGFVGGDTMAGIIATGLADAEGPTLLVDIGTNGEIVLAANGKISAASTAAGPAFEGARISRGMRGAVGAIEKVIVDGHLRINVIGNVRPVGLCGSGLIDAAAELLRHGIITPQGRLLGRDQLPDALLPELAERVETSEGQTTVALATAEEAADGRAILLTQRDIRELQLASGAIRAGVAILLRRAGLAPGDLAAVLIGGGFGNFIRRRNAQRIGLLPPEIERRRIRYMGNTSLAGAKLLALSLAARHRAELLARCIEHVDLSVDAGFHEAFAEAMLFPEG